MSDKLGLGNEVHELKVGKSFSNDTSVAFHTFRYDFKPASVDTSKTAAVDIGEGNSATVTVPHIQGSGQTVYKGNKRPVQKECVLIIDQSTGEVTLEKLSSTLQLKKTRTEQARATVPARPLTPSDTSKLPDSKATLKPALVASPAAPAPVAAGDSSSSGSDSSDDNSDDGTRAKSAAHPPAAAERPRTTSLLRDDLLLSESGSDSD